MAQAPDLPKIEPAASPAATAVNPPDPLTVQADKPTVDEAKRRFVEAMHAVDLLEPLRNHPYVVLGSAATAGAVLGSSGKVILGAAGLAGALAKMAKPLGGLLAQLAAAKLAAHTAVKETEPDPAETNVDPAEVSI
jgi:hypothetical protein